MNNYTEIDVTIQPATAAEERAGYKLLADGGKHYLRANVFDYIACGILPGFGLIYGAYAFFKTGEKKRGMSMMLPGGFLNFCALLASMDHP